MARNRATPRRTLDLVYFCRGADSEACAVCRPAGPVRCSICRRSVGCQLWQYVPLLCPQCTAHEFGQSAVAREWSRPQLAAALGYLIAHPHPDDDHDHRIGV